MCTKLELFAKSGIENEYYLEDNLRCETTSSMTLNNATLFWHYKNVRKNVNDTVTHGSDTIIFDEGYWTFDMIQDKLRDNKIALKYNTYDNTCKIYSDKTLNLKSFGLLLGFSSSYTVLPKVWKTSSNAVDVNLGLRHVTLNCESINSAKNFDRQGRRSHTLFTFPVLPNQNLGSAVTYFSNIGSITPMNNGLFSSLTFTIGSNINDDDVGVIIYFEVIIKE